MAQFPLVKEKERKEMERGGRRRGLRERERMEGEEEERENEYTDFSNDRDFVLSLTSLAARTFPGDAVFRCS